MKKRNVESINTIHHAVPSLSWEKNQGLLFTYFVYMMKPLKENSSSLLTNPSHSLFPYPHLILVHKEIFLFECVFGEKYRFH